MYHAGKMHSFRAPPHYALHSALVPLHMLHDALYNELDVNRGEMAAESCLRNVTRLNTVPNSIDI